MQILEFCLHASEKVTYGRTSFFAINSNRFDSPLNVNEGIVDIDENGKKIPRIREITGQSRKIFRIYVDDLVKEKLLTQVKTGDARSKFYSITPLGIIHLTKSGLFFDSSKYPHPERNMVIEILQTFAQQNIKPYKSKIFGKEQFFKRDVNLLDKIAKWGVVSFRDDLGIVFSNIIIDQIFVDIKYVTNPFDFFISDGYCESIKIRLASFNFFKENYIQITELDRYAYFDDDTSLVDPKSSELSLNEKQFHHYLANLILCSFIYSSARIDFDSVLLKVKKNMLLGRDWKINADNMFEENMNGVQESFLKILFLFSNHILQCTTEKLKDITQFKEKLNSLQFQKLKI